MGVIVTEYSIVGIIALIVSIIINIGFFRQHLRTKNVTNKCYRWFLISIICYFITDSLWGLLNHYHLMFALRLDTNIYFIAMALSVFFWLVYSVLFLGGGKKSVFNKIIVIYGTLITIFAITVVIINLFDNSHILFDFDENNNYYSKGIRYVILTVQSVAFIISALYGLIRSIMIKDNIRYRYLAVGSFGLVMSIGIVTQTFFPLLPLYAAGTIIAMCVYHIFVVNKEKEELLSARKLVRTDALTGAGSRYAYVELEEMIDGLIAKKEAKNFAVTVFDINGLKRINDTHGHDYGDELIKKCYYLIDKIYKDVLVYRIGGDEFVAIIRGDKYEERESLLKQFECAIDENLSNGDEVIISFGMSDYDMEKDNTYKVVFSRADRNMYACKKQLKKKK